MEPSDVNRSMKTKAAADTVACSYCGLDKECAVVEGKFLCEPCDRKQLAAKRKELREAKLRQREGEEKLLLRLSLAKLLEEYRAVGPLGSYAFFEICARGGFTLDDVAEIVGSQDIEELRKLYDVFAAEGVLKPRSKVPSLRRRDL